MGTGTEAQGAVVHPWAQSGQGRGWGGRGFGCEPLASGTSYALTVVFEKAGELDVSVDVKRVE